MNIEASVISLDCNHGVCPQIQGAVTCTITGTVATWYYPPSQQITRVASEYVSKVVINGFTAALVSISNSGLTTNLSFTATTDKNGTQVRCIDDTDRNLYYYDIRYQFL